MIEVFGYLLRTTFRNRITRRIARLREPRYLVPFVVSLLWFGTWVLRPLLRGGSHIRFGGWGMLPPDVREAFIFTGGIGIFVWIMLMWIVPDKKAALAFSPAELHFLFPAPITRRQLVQYKLLQAQVGIFFGAFVSAFFSGARLTHPDGWARVLAFWLFFAICHLHGIAASFVRTDLIEAGWSAVKRRALSIAVALVIVAAVYVSSRPVWWALAAAAATWVGPDREFKMASLVPVGKALAQAAHTEPASVILWPFLALPRLLFASTPAEFLHYGGIGLVIFLLHYVWVLRSDTSFEEASLELSQRVADRRAARRETARRGGRLAKRAGNFPWQLAPRGRPETALVWKNLVNLTRVTPMRALFALVAFVLALMTWSIEAAHAREGLWLLVALLCSQIATFTSVLGPVFLRNDLREDLFRIDAIKTMPLPGHAIVWAEILGSWTALALIQGAMIALGAFALGMAKAPPFGSVSVPQILAGGAGVLPYAATSMLSAFVLGVAQAPSVGDVTAPWLFAGAGAGLFILPGLALVAVALQNALVVLFPAWVALGNSRARGFEASGQRILTLFGTLFALVVVALPAAALGGGVAWFLSSRVGPVCLVIGAAIAAAWMIAEVAFACRLLGGVVDRLDPSTAGIESEDA